MGLPALGRLPWKERRHICAMVDAYLSSGTPLPGMEADKEDANSAESESATSELRDEISRLNIVIQELQGRLQEALLEAGNVKEQCSHVPKLDLEKTGALI